jgi:hypothetical protein
VWGNLAQLTKDTRCGRLFPSRVRTFLSALPPTASHAPKPRAS